MIKVNQDKCIGCQTCVCLCPQSYKLNGDYKAEFFGDLTDDAKNVIGACPVNAIELTA